METIDKLNNVYNIANNIVNFIKGIGAFDSNVTIQNSILNIALQYCLTDEPVNITF